MLDEMTYFKNHYRIRLVIIGGDGEKTPEYQDLVRKTRNLGIIDKIMFAGRIEHRNLPTYYNSADVWVMSSYYESFGMVGLEALACGPPAVSTPVGAADRLIRNGQAGHIVLDPSSQSLAQGIQSIITNRTIPEPDLIRQSILEYIWSNAASSIIAECESVLGQKFFEDDHRVSAEASCG